MPEAILDLFSLLAKVTEVTCSQTQTAPDFYSVQKLR